MLRGWSRRGRNADSRVAIGGVYVVIGGFAGSP